MVATNAADDFDPLLVLAALDHQVYRVARRARAERMTQFTLTLDPHAVDFHDRIARQQSSGAGGRLGGAGGNRGGQCVNVSPFERNAKQTGSQVCSLFHRVEMGPDVGQRGSESDAGVVPFGTRELTFLLWRQWDQDPDHAAANVDQRSAIVAGRNLGVRLHRFAPHAVDGAEDPDRHVGKTARIRATDGDGPLPDREFLTRYPRGHGKRFVRSHLEQHEHPALIAGDNRSRHAFARWQRHEDRGWFARKRKGTRENIAIRRDDQSGRGAGAQELSLELLQSAKRLDMHHARRTHAPPPPASPALPAR